MMEYFLVVAAYLIGSIPFGLVFGKWLGIDVRSGGSGNIGATNVNRLLGRKMGTLTLLADTCKGALPMLVTGFVLNVHPDRQLWVVFAGAAAFAGHLYPVYLKFKGGKGVATALGVFLYLAPPAVFCALAAFILTVWRWRYISLGSLVASAMLPIILWLLCYPRHTIWLAIFIGALIWLKHRANISRLLRHEENRIK